MHLRELAAHLDALLGHATAQDYEGAFNGLQVENGGEVRRVALAVDAHLDALRAAADWGADLLLAHHGLLWGGARPITGAAYLKLKLCVEAGLAVYASHLPLDAHPELGNAAGLARALGLAGGEPRLEAKGHAVGLRVPLNLDRAELAARLEAVTGRALLLARGPERVRSLLVVPGGGGGELERAAALGADTLLTGEAPQWADGLARDLGVNLLLGGHYATEVFGVQALGRHLSARFGLEARFLDLPSGL